MVEMYVMVMADMQTCPFSLVVERCCGAKLIVAMVTFVTVVRGVLEIAVEMIGWL